MGESQPERREYAQDLIAGELYFIEWKNVIGGSYSFTNNLTYMWYPAEIETWYTAASTSTNSMSHVFRHTEEQFEETRVVTNEFGNIQTNYLHGLTNTVTTLITNSIVSWTNTSETRKQADVSALSNHYIQRGDIIPFVFSNTNSVWLRLVGRR